jgi:hypothetical protein
MFVIGGPSATSPESPPKIEGIAEKEIGQSSQRQALQKTERLWSIQLTLGRYHGSPLSCRRVQDVFAQPE